MSQSTVEPSRDPKYYFPDGSAVFLVDSVLFRVHSSMLTSQSEVFSDMFHMPQAGAKDASTQEGMSDDNPIIIPDIEVEPFCNLLLLFYGMITDPDYRTLITDTTDKKPCGCDLFKQYFDIACLAHRFCMPKIEEWALMQLEQTLSSSERLAKLEWNYKHLLQAVDYSHRTSNIGLIRKLRNMVSCHLQESNLDTPWDGLQQASYVRDRDTLIPMFKDSELKKMDPSLFGHVFCSVLKKGHTSPTWRHLTRDDRAKLLAAQVYLTPLPSFPEWTRTPAALYSALDSNNQTPCISTCSDRFWTYTFSNINNPTYLKQLESNTPLTAISALCQLPVYRHRIAMQLSSLSTWKCKGTCGSLLLGALDTHMESFFTSLSKSYHDRLD